MTRYQLIQQELYEEQKRDDDSDSVLLTYDIRWGNLKTMGNAHMSHRDNEDLRSLHNE